MEALYHVGLMKKKRGTENLNIQNNDKLIIIRKDDNKTWKVYIRVIICNLI